MKSTIEFENDRMRVTRVKGSGRGSVPAGDRHDRLVIYLQDSTVKRKEGTREETLRRRAGDVVWRPRSRHEIEVTQDGSHEVLIVELK